jgi:hypothetical protein
MALSPPAQKSKGLIALSVHQFERGVAIGPSLNPGTIQFLLSYSLLRCCFKAACCLPAAFNTPIFFAPDLIPLSTSRWAKIKARTIFHSAGHLVARAQSHMRVVLRVSTRPLSQSSAEGSLSTQL